MASKDGFRDSHDARTAPYHARPLAYDYDNNSTAALTPVKETLSDFPSIEEEYASASQKGLKPSRQSVRQSVIAQMAYDKEIPDSAGVKMFRQEEHRDDFVKGGKRRACTRCCFCTTITFFLVLIGLVAGFLLWVRPPNVEFLGLETPTNQQTVQQIPNGFELNFILNFNVSNPNFFGATFQKITAKAFYPIGQHSQLGGGAIFNIEIKSKSVTPIVFPFMVNYTSAVDPDQAILSDIISKCGFTTGKATDIKINYDLTLQFKLLLMSISPTISNSVSFACPLQQADLSNILGGNGLAGILGQGV